MSRNVLAILKLERKASSNQQVSYTYCQILNTLTRRSWSRLSPGELPGKGNGYPHQYFCQENSLDGESWRGYNPWIHKESYMTEQLTLHFLHGYASTFGQIYVARATRLWLSSSAKIQMVLMGASWLPVLPLGVIFTVLSFFSFETQRPQIFGEKPTESSDIHLLTE